MKKRLLIFGGQSTGLEIADLIDKCFNSQYTNTLYVVGSGQDLSSGRALSDEELHDFVAKNKDIYFIVSMTKQALRYKCLKIAKQYGLIPATIIHPDSYIAKSAKIGDGVYIAANTSISSNAKIHNNIIVNYNCVIGHDSIIHDNVIINPGVVVGGNVVVNERVTVGANSFILQGISIGSDSSIDAMTYIDRDIGSRSISSNRDLNTYP